MFFRGENLHRSRASFQYLKVKLLILKLLQPTPHHHAMLAFHLQDYLAIFMDKRKVIFDEVKFIELIEADEHTLVKFLRKNIPCPCLDEKYKEVKSVTKMGVCGNLECSLPNRMAERSTMLCCTGCRIANYCSRNARRLRGQGTSSNVEMSTH